MNKVYALVWNQAQGCWSVTDEGARRCRRSGTRKGLVVMVAGLLSLGGLPAAFALPTGGDVVSGSADIVTQGQQMSINQHTNKLITNWQDFSVQADQSVTFNQPSSTSIALNRVVGVNGSQIQGQINANGQVFLINPNGVVFGQGAQVNVGGLVASTQNISDDNFSAGNYTFSGTSTASVVNNGSITAADGGSVALLGAKVSNEGKIVAQNGRVALGAGGAFTVSFDDNNLLDLQVDAAAINALASNGGLLKADGGQVLMTANAGKMLQTVVNNQGTIEANTLSQKAGKITLNGGDTGMVNVGGSLSANALGTQGDGGVIETKSFFTTVQGDAKVNTQASNGQTGTLKIEAVQTAVGGNPSIFGDTIHADTLSRNLATTNVELASTKGDVSVNGPVAWNSGNQLTLSSAKDIQVNDSVKGAGANARVELNAKDNIKLNGKVELSGNNGSLALNHGGDFALGQDGQVTLSGKNARFDANGTEYTVIQNVKQLQAIDNDRDGQYVLGNTLNGDDTLTPMWLRGTFDGLGNTISGYTVTGEPSAFGGLFSGSNGKISNLNLASMTINCQGCSIVGGLVGFNTGEITNVSTSNLWVSGGDNTNRDDRPNGGVGGLVGYNQGGFIIGSSSSGTVVSSYIGRDYHGPNLGGLVGYNFGSIESSTSTATVVGYGQSNVGGLVGLNLIRVINNSAASGQVVGFRAATAGGLVGLNWRGTLLNVKASGSVNVQGSSNVGGLIGENRQGEVHTAAASGVVISQDNSNVGGLIGSNDGSLSSVKASGNVHAGSNSSAGGLVGIHNNGVIDEATATGRVFGGNNSSVGGLVGENNALVTNSRTSSLVRGGSASRLGSLAGVNQGTLSYNVVSGQASRAPLVGINQGVIRK